ncbi:hypothetical protein [Thiohalobacter thiocyanaticus]|uniref:hypothetical protein n=1 Tax=Thiohalobacter thiocyanaticus TaxID=585455 RepID=UPI000F63B98C|nr:hypothetical protein [Thiohalobacter thiocyanaticus]
MKKIIITALLSICVFHEPVSAEMIIDLSCDVSGLKINGETSKSGFIEKIYVNHSVSEDGWGISKSEITSDGKKIESTLIDLKKDYAVLSYSATVGSGFNKTLLVFNYVLDLQAMELTRTITSLPKGMEERTTGKCK